MLVASGNKYTCSLSPIVAYRSVSFRIVILQYTGSGKEKLTGGTDDLAYVSHFLTAEVWAENDAAVT